MVRSNADIDQSDGSRSSNEKPGFVASTGSSLSVNAHASEEDQLDKGTVSDSPALDISQMLSRAGEKKLLRRIDWRLLPLLAAMYVVKTIDAQNVGHPAQKSI
jgi:hypothetical protein